MRKGKVLSLKNFNQIVEFLIKNRILLLLSSFFILGFIIAISISEKYELLKNLNLTLLNNFINNRVDKTFIHILIKSFFSYMLFIMLGFVCGSSILGSLFIPLVVSFKGYLFGGVSTLLYSEYSLKGIAFYTVLILPSAAIFLFGFLFAMRESFDFSLMLTRLAFPQTLPINISFQFKRFSFKYLIVIFIIIFSALVDAWLSKNFLMAFNLN